MRIRPSTFVSITSRSSSSLDSQTGSRPSARPALLTRMSRPPSSASARSTNARELSGSVTSRVPSRREPTKTRAPASSSARAVAAPIPLEAPVTIARLPAREVIAERLTLTQQLAAPEDV